MTEHTNLLLFGECLLELRAELLRKLVSIDCQKTEYIRGQVGVITEMLNHPYFDLNADIKTNCKNPNKKEEA